MCVSDMGAFIACLRCGGMNYFTCYFRYHSFLDFRQVAKSGFQEILPRDR